MYEPPIQTLNSPSEGLMYYRADTFGGAARGNLFVGHWNQGLYRVVLNTEGTEVTNTLLDVEEGQPTSEVLDVKDFPGGAVCGLTYARSQFVCQVPIDKNAESG